jgi:hypothetical protein
MRCNAAGLYHGILRPPLEKRAKTQVCNMFGFRTYGGPAIDSKTRDPYQEFVVFQNRNPITVTPRDFGVDEQILQLPAAR